MEDNQKVERQHNDKRNIIALILITVGLLLMLDTFDVIQISLWQYIFSWKTILIAIGVVIIASSENKLPGYILIGLGFVFWAPSIFDYNIHLGQVFWPVILIAIGLIIISRRNRHDRFLRGQRTERTADGTISSNYIDDVSIFGGGIKRYSSQQLKGGNITAIFGGSEIDLTTSEMSSGGSVIDVFTMFGGTKLIIPGSWQVKSEATSLFGGFTDKRHIKPDQVVSDKILLIKGVVIFGGVEIKNY